MPVFLISGSWTPDIRIDGRRRFRWGLRCRRPPPMCGRRSGSHVCGRAAAECPLQVRAEGPGHLGGVHGGSRLSVRGSLSVIPCLGVRPYSRRIIRIETIPRQVFKKDLRGRLLRDRAPFSHDGVEEYGESSHVMQKGRMIRSRPPDLQGSAGLPPPFREMSFPTQE